MYTIGSVAGKPPVVKSLFNFDPAKIPAIELADFHAAKLPVPPELIAVLGENAQNGTEFLSRLAKLPDGGRRLRENLLFPRKNARLRTLLVGGLAAA